MTEHNEERNLNILLIEDNPADAFLTKEILLGSETASYEIAVLQDGVEALSYLCRIDGYEYAPKPDLILLDLNLPRMHGLDFLARIKATPNLNKIPVVILTTSESREDVLKAEELKADCYLAKPLDLESFESILARIYPC